MSNNQGGRSVAIWGEGLPGVVGSHSKKLNVHFNYWHNRSQKAKNSGPENFLDIGIMAYDCSHLSRLRIYLPLAVAISDIEDLGPLFSEPVVASIVFNESLSTTSTHNSNHVALQFADNNLYSRVYKFTRDGKESPFKSEELDVARDGDGTSITICRAAIVNGYAGLSDERPLYFRLRIRMPAKGDAPFSRTIRPADSWLLSSFEYTEFLDFRLNEARNLPQNATQQMWPAGPQIGGSPPISRVDFLVIVGEAADVAEGVECDKKRLLESELWDTYTKTLKGCQEKLSDGMVIYHWKKTPKTGAKDIGDFSAFIKLRIRRSGASLVSRYLIVVALIGCLGSLFANIAWSRFSMEKWFKPTELDAENLAVESSAACLSDVGQAAPNDSSGGRVKPESGRSAINANAVR